MNSIKKTDLRREWLIKINHFNKSKEKRKIPTTKCKAAIAS